MSNIVHMLGAHERETQAFQLASSNPTPPLPHTHFPPSPSTCLFPLPPPHASFHPPLTPSSVTSALETGVNKVGKQVLAGQHVSGVDPCVYVIASWTTRIDCPPPTPASSCGLYVLPLPPPRDFPHFTHAFLLLDICSLILKSRLCSYVQVSTFRAQLFGELFLRRRLQVQ